jgi:N-acyl-D-amino-acid deacylase
MSKYYDLVIRGGTVVDGTGRDGHGADIGVAGGKIVDVGKIASRGREEIDAKGMLVTPGFVDIHTHYDGQATWESLTEPSSTHGVTTVVTGNCGVGFAPCRPQDRDRLIKLMEGVEDIPEAVMAKGLPWNWETFPEYLDAVANRPHDIDFAAMLPHACARVYVMGERAADRQVATEKDLAEMTRITEEAMRAGAIGFGTSRSISHRDSKGQQIPTKHAAEVELMAFASGMKNAGHGVIEAVFDLSDIDQEFAMLKRVAQSSGRPVTFTLAQTLEHPDAWRRGLPLLKQAKEEGIRIKGQIIGRASGLMLGFGVSYNPFSRRHTYVALANLPLEKRIMELHKPEVREKILNEKDGPAKYHALIFLTWLDRMFVLGDPPNYHQPLDQSIRALAAQKGVTAEEYVYDAMLEDNGQAIVFLALGNYVDGTLGTVSAMLNDENTVLGLGDGGAHYGMVCDAGYPTFMLTYWGRDAIPENQISIPTLIKKLSADPAETVELYDRGYIKPGYKPTSM